MPLVILCGLPCSGKTRIAEQLCADLDARIRRAAELDERDGEAGTSGAADRANSHSGSKKRKRRQYRTVLVNDATLHLPKSAYDAGVLEKRARGALLAAVERSLGRESIVICDAMNYVKGFRYQLHCEAKAVATPHCCLYVAAPEEACRGWWSASRSAAEAAQSSIDGSAHSADDAPGTSEPNGERVTASDGAKAIDRQVYPEKVFEELLMRFEEPQGTVRWDKPLFTVVSTDTGPRGRPPTRDICAHLAPDLVFDDADEVGLEDFVPELSVETDDTVVDDAVDAGRTMPSTASVMQMSLAQRMAMANLEPPRDADGNIPSYETAHERVRHGSGTGSTAGRTDSFGSMSSDDDDEDDELADLPPNLRPSTYRQPRQRSGSKAAGSTTSARSSYSTGSAMSQRTTASVAQARAMQMARGTAGDVKPHGATTVSANAHTRADHLQRLERALGAVVRAVAAAARKGEDRVEIDLATEPRSTLAIPNGEQGACNGTVDEAERGGVFVLNLPEDARLGMADLQRLKRQFLSINRNAATLATAPHATGAKDADGVVKIDPAKRLFCVFLASQFGDGEGN